METIRRKIQHEDKVNVALANLTRIEELIALNKLRRTYPHMDTSATDKEIERLLREEAKGG
jgi:hypothetical protein